MKKIEETDKKFKSWLKSKTIWGIILVLLPTLSNLIGFDVGVEVGETYTELLQIVGSVLALYGRWKANTGIAMGNIKNNKK